MNVFIRDPTDTNILRNEIDREKGYGIDNVPKCHENDFSMKAYWSLLLCFTDIKKVLIISKRAHLQNDPA